MKNVKHVLVSVVFLFVLIFVGVAVAIDSDNDGMSDLYENFFKLNPTNALDAALNLDSDSLVNSNEAAIWTDPRVADTDADGFLDGADSNALSRAVMMWGHPDFTSNNVYRYTGPQWWLGAGKEGGVWEDGSSWVLQTNAQGSLYMDLDRAILTNNLMMSVLQLNASNTLVTVDLVDTNGIVVATNVVGDITIDDGSEAVTHIEIPLTNYPSASQILLNAQTAQVEYKVFGTSLYIDADQDGLDADQEAQLGTDDSNSDSDNDGLNDYAEVMVYKSDPTKADTDGDGLLDGREVNELGISPIIPVWLEGGIDGFLQVDRWNNLSGATKIKGLILAPRFGVQVDAHYFVNVSEQPLDKSNKYGVRIRGTVTAPEAGVYKFRLSAKKAAQVWFSDTASPYNRKLLIDQPVPVKYHSITPPPVVDRTAEKSLTSNQVCYVEILLKTAKGGGHATLWWQRPGSTLWEVIPAQYLHSYEQPSDDQDQDGLPDAWETANGLNSNNGRGGGYLDHDGDLVSDLEEYQLGTSPSQLDADHDGLKGVSEVMITHTDPTKMDTDGDGIPDCVVESTLRGIDTIYRRTGHVSAMWKQKGEEDLKMTKLMHYVINSYVEYSMDVTTEGMKQLTLSLGWDHKPNMSGRPLVRFYIDGNEMPTVKVDNSGCAVIFTPWLTTGPHRIRCRFLPPGKTIVGFWIHSISLAAIDGADADGDGIQDWMQERLDQNADADADADGISDQDEVQVYHTDPLLADTDGDGLNDKDEIDIWLTEPTLADTDGDGVSDGDEVLHALTNPLVADFGTATIVTTIPGASFTPVQGTWCIDASKVYALSYNGALEYSLNLPSNGVYVAEVELTQHNDLPTDSLFDIEAFVDGIPLGAQTKSILRHTTGTMRFWLPNLSSGNHVLRLKWNNLIGESSLQINAIRLFDFSGPDTNANGRADWLDTRLAQTVPEMNLPQSSLTSPVCVEGSASFPDTITLTADFVPVGATQQVCRATKTLEGNWYTDLLLSPSSDTTVQLDGGQGAPLETFAANWAILDLEAPSTTNLTLRLNDALLLKYLPTGASNGCVQLVIDGANGSVTNIAPATAPIPYIFETKGEYTVTATYSTNTQAFVQGTGATNLYGFVNGSADPSIFTNGTTSASIDVLVVSGSFAADPYFRRRARKWLCSNISKDSFIEHDPAVNLSSKAINAGGVRFTLSLNERKTSRIVARTVENGPILDVATVRPLDLKKPSSWTSVYEYPDGSTLGLFQFILDDVPADLRIKVKIITAGVTFLDGGTIQIFTAADFNDEGVLMYYLLRSSGITSTCREITILQGNEAF